MGDTASEIVQWIVVPGLTAFIVGLLFWLSRTLIKLKQDPELLRTILPDDVERWISESVQFATRLVETLDLEDRLQEWADITVDKSETKLLLAVDMAAKQIELRLVAMGFKVNLDSQRDAIKDAIQKYVFDNPDLFPKRKNIETGE